MNNNHEDLMKDFLLQKGDFIFVITYERILFFSIWYGT